MSDIKLFKINDNQVSTIEGCLNRHRNPKSPLTYASPKYTGVR